MLRYITKRGLSLIFVLFGMTVLTFWLSHMIPADPARLMAGQQASAAQVAQISRKFGLDKPIPEQYMTYMAGVLRGDFGESMTTRRPVLKDLQEFFPATLELTSFSLLLIVLAGIPSGLYAAARRNGLFDKSVYGSSLVAVSIPTFWLGLLLQLCFYRYLDWLPVGGRLGIEDLDPERITGFITVDALLAGDVHTFWSAIVHLILPAATLAAGSVAMVFRMTRASAVEVLKATYIQAVRSRGICEAQILVRHVMPNAILPTITVIGLQIGVLISGSVVVESVFGWPGVGSYMVSAIKYLDYQAIVGVTILVAVVFVFSNLVVDLAYISFNPLIRGRML